MWRVDVEDDVAKVADGEAEHKGGDADAKGHLQDNIYWHKCEQVKRVLMSTLAKWANKG